MLALLFFFSRAKGNVWPRHSGAAGRQFALQNLKSFVMPYKFFAFVQYLDCTLQRSTGWGFPISFASGIQGTESQTKQQDSALFCNTYYIKCVTVLHVMITLRK